MATTVDTDEVQKLYDISTALDENVANFGSDTAKYEEMYNNILSLSKGGQKAKMLAAQFIPKYLVHFPKFADESINCLIDLCEEEDLSTRISAIRALPVIARNTPESLPKLADILGQLLQAELPVELDRVKQSLVSLLQQDLKGTLATLFTQATSEIEDLRVKAIAFIFEKVLPMRNEINATEDLQKFVSEHVKKVLPHVVSAKEFQMFIDLLSGLKIYTKAAIASELLDVLADIISTDESNTAKLTTCIQAAAEFLQRKGANSAKFTGVLASTVLPAFGQLKELQQVELIHKMTDVVGHLNADDAKTLLPPLYELLLAHIPAADAPVDQEHKINFSIVESALYMFHVLAAKAPGSLRGLCGINVVTGQPSTMSTELAVDKKKELDARLKLLEETTSKNYVKPMEEVRKSLQKATTTEDTQKKKIIEISLKATHNILLLAKNLQSKNPTFGAVTNDIVLSFKLGKPVAKKQLPPTQSTATTIPKPAPRVAKPAAATTTATQSSGTARPAFGNVYVPPKRQQQQQQPASKKREVEATTSSEPKKHKGRGSSKFQGLV